MPDEKSPEIRPARWSLEHMFTNLVSPVSPLIAQALGIRIAVRLGLLVVAGVTVMAVFAPHGGYLSLAGALVLVGTGLGLSQAPANDALMGSAPTERSGLV